MHQIFNKTLLITSLALAMSSAVYATNGLAPTGLGQVHKAMGGAAAGNPVNTMSMATNPAAASFISDGFDVGAEIFKPNRVVTNSAWVDAVQPGLGGTVYKGNAASAFFNPEGGYKKDLGKSSAGNISAGLIAYGNGGTSSTTGVDLKFQKPLVLPMAFLCLIFIERECSEISLYKNTPLFLALFDWFHQVLRFLAKFHVLTQLCVFLIRKVVFNVFC